MPSSPMPPPLPFALLERKRLEELLWVVIGKVERISGRVIHSVRSGSIWDHLIAGLNSRTLSRSRLKGLNVSSAALYLGGMQLTA